MKFPLFCSRDDSFFLIFPESGWFFRSLFLEKIDFYNYITFPLDSGKSRIYTSF